MSDSFATLWAVAHQAPQSMEFSRQAYWNGLLCSSLLAPPGKPQVSIQSAKTRPGADCDSDHELLIAKFRLKLKKVGKTTKPYRYDLNQIPFDYTVALMNRFKGLNLVDRVPEELWTEVCNIVQETVIKTFPQIKKYKKAN